MACVYQTLLFIKKIGRNSGEELMVNMIKIYCMKTLKESTKMLILNKEKPNEHLFCENVNQHLQFYYSTDDP